MNREFLYPGPCVTLESDQFGEHFPACAGDDGATATRKKAQQWESERKFPKNPKKLHYHAQTVASHIWSTERVGRRAPP